MAAKRWAKLVRSALLGAIATGAFVERASAIETVVVTAERRTTDVQKTSIAVTVLTAADLKQKSVNVVDQLQFATPSLTIDNFGQGNDFNIRGIGKGESNIQTPSGVVTYRDGIPVLGGIIQDEPYYDLASVEVLRGPQGTFAGTNATGGAVFIVEQNPALDDRSGYVRGQVGSYADVGIQGAVNVPLSDDAAMRIALNSERRDSFWTITKGAGFSGDPGSLKEISGRVSFLWEPMPNLEIRFKTDVNYIDQGGYPADPTGFPEDIFHISNDTHNMGFDKNLRTALDVKYTFVDGIIVRSLTGYQYGRAAEQIDLDGIGGPGDPDFTFRDKGIVRIFSQELNLLSPDSGPFKWVLGGFFQHEDDDLPANDGFDIGLFGFLNVVLTYHTPKQHEAVFGQATYDLSDEWQIQVGARFNHSSFDLTDHQATLAFGAPIPGTVFNVPCTAPGTLFAPCPTTRSGHEEDSKLTEKIALNFKPDDRNYLYAFFATGHKDGGQNTTANQPANIRPEEVRNVEIGWKSTFADGHVRTQLDGYWNDYKDFQLSIFDTTSQQSAILNAPSAKIWGFEGQMQGGWEQFSFDLNASYLHSRFGSFFAEPSAPPPHVPPFTCDPHTGGTSPTCQNLTGEENVYAPRWTVNGGLQYAILLADGDTLTPRVDYAHISSQWPSVFHDPAKAGFVPRIGARDLVNAQLTYAMEDNWEFTAFATNLFDLHYVAAENVSLRYAGPPRQVGFRAIKSF